MPDVSWQRFALTLAIILLLLTAVVLAELTK